MQKTFTTKSDQETIALGSKLGALLSGGEFIALTGDLGGGKTQFTKGIAKGLGITETIVSPTFTIERVYGNLHHFDLYRISNDTEVAAGIKDLVSVGKSIVVVEWPENIESIQPPDHLAIEFKYIEENIRELTMTEHGKHAKTLLEKL
jgi:tRNA threonylcarbamoyladenosine biosynthesis protein TsaE